MMHTGSLITQIAIMFLLMAAACCNTAGADKSQTVQGDPARIAG